jgi:phospholipase/lecithinase/hemolysin
MAGIAAACAAAAALAAAAPAEAGQAYPALFVFGDSLSDAGNAWIATSFAEPKSPPYFFGRFSNGPVWSQELARALNLPRLTPSLAGGRDYAVGGAESGATPVHTANPSDLPAQLALFATNAPHPRKGALYALWIGANDLSDILAGSATLGPTGVQAAVAQVIANEVSAIDTLHAAGAANFLVLNIPDLGKAPALTTLGPAVSAAASQLVATFNTGLAAAMAAEAASLHVQMTIVDTYALIDAAVADPAAYGFTNVTTPCWTGTYTGTGGTLCSIGWYRQNDHLFWDQLHPTFAGHLQVAKAAEAALP